MVDAELAYPGGAGVTEYIPAEMAALCHHLSVTVLDDGSKLDIPLLPSGVPA